MRVRFWGVRGSTPTPQKENMGYGGNTSCVEIRTESGEILILDGGTGLRLLGNSLEREFNGSPIKAHLFFSHFHLDHIQGIPFFRPLYRSGNHFTFYFAGRNSAAPTMDALAGMMANPYFPVDMSNLPCSRNYVDLMEGTFSIADTKVQVMPLNHPQGCFGFRIMQHGKVVTYCTDVEHGPAWSNANVKTLARDADFMIVDSQYTPEELLDHSGWGHSCWKQSVEMGKEAGARQIALFHYDPSREDAEVDEILLSAKQCHHNVIAAREGLEITV